MQRQSSAQIFEYCLAFGDMMTAPSSPAALHPGRSCFNGGGVRIGTLLTRSMGFIASLIPK